MSLTVKTSLCLSIQANRCGRFLMFSTTTSAAGDCFFDTPLQTDRGVFTHLKIQSDIMKYCSFKPQ